MAKQLSDLLYKARKENQQPSCISDEVWQKYLDYWKSDDFKKKAAASKKNKNSEKGGSLHCCESVNQAQHAMRLTRKAGRPLTIAELHRATHVKKNTNTYVDERSRKTQEKLAETMFEATQGTWNPESLGPLEPEVIALANRTWEVVAGGMYKGRLYGTGPLAPNLSFGVDGVTHLDTSGPSTSRPPSADTEQLKKMVEAYAEQMQKMQAEHAQQLEMQNRTISNMQADFSRFINHYKSLNPDAPVPHVPPPSESDDLDSDADESDDPDAPY